MNITTYFLKHPVITLVLNAMIVIIGIICFDSLSVREYPEVQLPKVLVRATYPNASAELVENSVTNVLEDKLAVYPTIDFCGVLLMCMIMAAQFMIWLYGAS